MKENTIACLFYALSLLFLPLTVSSQSNYPKIPINENTLNIVERCDRIVMKGFQKQSRGKKMDPQKITDMEEIELKYVEGPNGYIMAFVRDKDNPERASQTCRGFIGKKIYLKTRSEYSEDACRYVFLNSSNSALYFSCNKGTDYPEFYVFMGDNTEQGKEDIHLITRVDFYEKGSNTPILKDVFLLREDYSVNLFKFFLEIMLEKFE